MSANCIPSELVVCRAVTRPLFFHTGVVRARLDMTHEVITCCSWDMVWTWTFQKQLHFSIYLLILLIARHKFIILWAGQSLYQPHPFSTRNACACARTTPPLCHAMAVTGKYCAVNSRALQKSFSHVVTAISISDPLKVGDALFTASLVPQETLAKLELPTNTDYMKSRILVMSVMDQVKLVPDKLKEFMEVLQNLIDQSSFDSESACHSCLISGLAS